MHSLQRPHTCTRQTDFFNNVYECVCKTVDGNEDSNEISLCISYVNTYGFLSVIDSKLFTPFNYNQFKYNLQLSI